MKPTHTSEPWEILKQNHNLYIGNKQADKYCTGGFSWRFVCRPFPEQRSGAKRGTSPSWYGWSELVEANAARIVSCVNACAGINPAAVPEIVDALERLLACACPTGMDTETDRAMEQARAALALAKA